MFLPDDIDRAEFSRTLCGYSPREVDEFLDELKESLDGFCAENEELRRTVLSLRIEAEKLKAEVLRLNKILSDGGTDESPIVTDVDTGDTVEPVSAVEADGFGDGGPEANDDAPVQLVIPQEEPDDEYGEDEVPSATDAGNAAEADLSDYTDAADTADSVSFDELEADLRELLGDWDDTADGDGDIAAAAVEGEFFRPGAGENGDAQGTNDNGDNYFEVGSFDLGDTDADADAGTDGSDAADDADAENADADGAADADTSGTEAGAGAESWQGDSGAAAEDEAPPVTPGYRKRVFRIRKSQKGTGQQPRNGAPNDDAVDDDDSVIDDDAEFELHEYDEYNFFFGDNGNK